MVEYKECYVAFLDILGFKDLINIADCDRIYNIFQTILDFEPHPLTKKTDAYKKINYTIMSDSIIICVETAITDGFIALADVCSQVQMKLLQNNPPILLRGGIEKGSLYHKDNILFGQGLTKAYMLENNAAVYPRIIFTEELRQNGLINADKLYVFDYNFMYYQKDDDEFYYIDYLRTFNFLLTSGAKNCEEVKRINNKFFDNLMMYVDSQLNVKTNLSIREKYLWLKKKIKERIECMPDVKVYFDEISRKQQEERDKRFSETLKDD